MPAYHSSFLGSDQSERVIGSICLLPIHTKFRGPSFPPQEEYDIVEEVLDLFRANSFFKNFEIKGPADRLLIYGILYVSQCLSKLTKMTPMRDASRTLNNLALDSFPVPGEIGFPLNSLYYAPSNKNDADLLRAYLLQFRQELADRLIRRIYEGDTTAPNKFWLAFTRRRFMNRSL